MHTTKPSEIYARDKSVQMIWDVRGNRWNVPSDKNQGALTTMKITQTWSYFLVHTYPKRPQCINRPTFTHTFHKFKGEILLPTKLRRVKSHYKSIILDNCLFFQFNKGLNSFEWKTTIKEKSGVVPLSLTIVASELRKLTITLCFKCDFKKNK